MGSSFNGHANNKADEPAAGATARHAAISSRVFVLCVIAMLFAPLLLMPFCEDDSKTEKRELAPAPQVIVDGKPNINLLSDAGDYYSDHFALRSVLVDVDATIKQRLFMTSSTPNVVVGSGGWLYYAGTLNDYQRRYRMSDQALRNAAENLRITQEYVGSLDKGFVVVIAPNKNELYPEHMPYYEMHGEGDSNFERLVPLLEQRGISFVNLHQMFRATDEVLYFERDSHWTDEGAMRAYTEIMHALKRDPLDPDDCDATDDAHLGDVDGMLHPAFAKGENQASYDLEELFSFANDATDVEESYIITQGNAPNAKEGLIMYRDSFGNNLLAPFASSYAKAVFTKLVPYDMSGRMCGFADDVVIERTERHLDAFATDPPYLPALERSIDTSSATQGGDFSLYVRQNGPYTVIEGNLDEATSQKADGIYVLVQKNDGTYGLYEAFRVSQKASSSSDYDKVASDDDGRIVGDAGFRSYLPKEDVGEENGASAQLYAMEDGILIELNPLDNGR